MNVTGKEAMNPIFYMMMGLPGSGKSWYASTLESSLKTIGGDPVIHASDEIRKEILGDENSQQDNAMVFDELHSRVKRDLAAGKQVIYDATNLSHKRRKTFLRELDDLHIDGLEKICVFVYKPFDQCVQANTERDRTVPEPVIARMRKRFDPPVMSEGWDEITLYHNHIRNPLNLEDLFARLDKFPQENPNHTLTLGKHMEKAVKLYLTETPTRHFNSDVYLALRLHDIGKEATKTFYDTKGNVSEYAHYYNHENVGAYDSFLYTCLRSKESQLRIAKLIRWHMYPFVISKSQNVEKTRQKLVNTLGENDYKAVMTMYRYDRAAH